MNDRDRNIVSRFNVINEKYGSDVDLTDEIHIDYYKGFFTLYHSRGKGIKLRPKTVEMILNDLDRLNKEEL